MAGELQHADFSGPDGGGRRSETLEDAFLAMLKCHKGRLIKIARMFYRDYNEQQELILEMTSSRWIACAKPIRRQTAEFIIDSGNNACDD